MRIIHLTLRFAVLVWIVSCATNDEDTSQPITKANIIGSVNLYDEGTIPIDNSGMTIKVEGISPIISTITDANGDFTLLDVPFGTYTISYEKAGFGSFKKFSLEHTNTTGTSTIITNNPSLGQLSSTEVLDLSTTLNGSEIEISITTNPAGNIGNTRYLRYFLSANSSVNNENYSFHSEGIISQNNPRVIKLSQDDLNSAGFSSGSTVYIKAYGDSYWSNEYEDLDLERKIFPNLNMTTVNSVSFTAP